MSFKGMRIRLIAHFWTATMQDRILKKKKVQLRNLYPQKYFQIYTELAIIQGNLKGYPSGRRKVISEGMPVIQEEMERKWIGNSVNKS